MPGPGKESGAGNTAEILRQGPKRPCFFVCGALWPANVEPVFTTCNHHLSAFLEPLCVEFSCRGANVSQRLTFCMANAYMCLRTFALIDPKNSRSSGNFDYEYRFLIEGMTNSWSEVVRFQEKPPFFPLPMHAMPLVPRSSVPLTGFCAPKFPRCFQQHRF